MSEPSAQDLQALAEMRLKDAVVLLDNKRWSAAYYLAGYSVECGIKAVIALSFRAQVIPDRRFVTKIYSHDLEDLADLAGLKAELNDRLKMSDPYKENWAVVSGWSEQTRYETTDTFMSVKMVEAVADQQAGVLPWLKTYW